MRIALGSDHRGYEAMRNLMTHLEAFGHSSTVYGECNGEPCDYPDMAWAVGQAVAGNDADVGILLCSNGIGMSIAANKIPGVRAALVYDADNARRSRLHNNSNVLCLGGEMNPLDDLNRIVEVWLETPFEGGRHQRRVNKIDAIERGENPANSSADAAAAG